MSKEFIIIWLSVIAKAVALIVTLIAYILFLVHFFGPWSLVAFSITVLFLTLTYMIAEEIYHRRRK